jgi:hypothetical protein
MRRLPVLQNTATDDVPSRPPWQWVAIGAALAISMWIPLLTVSLWLRTRLLAGVFPTDAAALAERVQSASPGHKLVLALSALVPVLVPWLVACAAAGAIVGRFGGAAGRRHALYSGLSAAALALAVALLGGALASPLAFASSALVLGTSAAGAAWMGGKFGEKRRYRL